MSSNRITEYLRRNNIKDVYYFHADHFEPASLSGKMVVKEDDIRDFIEQTNRHNSSRKQTLFVRVPIVVAHKNSPRRDIFNIQKVENDIIYFGEAKAAKKAAKVIKEISDNTNHEFQIHIHHEHFTKSAESYFKKEASPERDSDRLSLFIKMSLDFMKKNTSQDFNEWFFVHGKWALNASDRRICNIEDELKILLENGCRGDFTFPAGRRNCDPATKFPFTCKPISINRAYDYLHSDVKAVVPNIEWIRKSRFFIWNSECMHPTSSLDLFSDRVFKQLSTPEKFMNNLVNKSPIISSKLFIKTYSHSLDERHLNDFKYFPTTHPNVLKAFDILEAACKNSNTNLHYVTAKEVFRIFKNIEKGRL
jgi:hypothetical protein